MKKYGRTRLVTDDNTIWRRKDARIQKHTRNISYLVFFHGNNVFVNAP